MFKLKNVRCNSTILFIALFSSSSIMASSEKSINEETTETLEGSNQAESLWGEMKDDLPRFKKFFFHKAITSIVFGVIFAIAFKHNYKSFTDSATYVLKMLGLISFVYIINDFFSFLLDNLAFYFTSNNTKLCWTSRALCFVSSHLFCWQVANVVDSIYVYKGFFSQISGVVESSIAMLICNAVIHLGIAGYTYYTSLKIDFDSEEDNNE